jgi:hypothetical protein
MGGLHLPQNVRINGPESVLAFPHKLIGPLPLHVLEWFPDHSYHENSPHDNSPRNNSPHRHLAPRTSRPTDISPHGHLAPRTSRPTNISPHGQLAPWTFCPTDRSPHGQPFRPMDGLSYVHCQKKIILVPKDSSRS